MSAIYLQIGLLIVGTGATFAAFGGSTWNKWPDGTFRSLNRRGRISIACWIFAFLFGVAAEYKKHNEKVASDGKSAQLQEQLQKSQEDLKATRADLEMLRRRIEGVPVDIAAPSFSKDHNVDGTFVKYDRQKLIVYGGEILEYFAYETAKDNDGPPYLKIGSHTYPLQRRDTILVEGPSNTPLTVQVLDYSDRPKGFGIKFHLKSIKRDKYDAS